MQQTNTVTIILIAALLLLFIDGFFFQNGSFFFVILGLFLLIYGFKRHKKFLFWTGSIILLLTLLSMWSMRALAVLILLYMIMKLVRKEPREYAISFHEKTRNDAIEERANRWQDVHVQNVIGSIEIDTTTTILRKGISIINIRQGIGKTTVIVPYELSVSIRFNTFYGEFIDFEQRPRRLFNEAITLEENAVSNDNQRLIIYVSSLLGDLEVIQK